ncbi:hypothetical protein [Actinoplanes sp. NPDC051411]|uniref:hypothetical protein n=1 Tax=Actinoplanes sp. NPDC051411 TaxID=3155522 RepID=UPI003424F6AB
MRRPVLYLAGLLLATGASLALAGPASAAPSHHRHHNHHCNNNDWRFDSDSNDYRWYELHSNSQNNGSEYNGIVLLSGNSGNGDGGLLGGGILG